MTELRTFTKVKKGLDIVPGTEALPIIPTDDPQAALEFCRALAKQMVLLQESSQDALQPENFFEENSVLPTEKKNLLALSVVVPVFNEQDNLLILYNRLLTVLETIEPSFEIVFVDDGSRDQSKDILQSLASKDERILIVELARNFGHQVAISAGLDHARGQGVIIMDADLQDPPEVLPEFIEKWRAGYEVVYAIRTQRKEGWLLRSAYALFYRMLRKIANIQIPLDAGDFCIMDRKVVDILIQMPERNRFVRGIRSWVGLNQTGLVYDRQPRHAGESKYQLNKLVYLALDGLVSFSFIPLRIISIVGMSVSALSLVLAVFYVLKKLLVGLNPPGFASLMVSIFFLSGMQLITIGVIGEYVGRIFEEVKRRPLYIIRKITRGRANARSDAG